MDEINIKLDKEFLNKFFRLANTNVSEDIEIDLNILKANLNKLEDLSNKFEELKNFVEEKRNEEKEKKSEIRNRSRDVGSGYKFGHHE
ncbi:MAG: hypothetical protein ACI37S_02565 [Candidatus Gastranaerophilaceae bacterium]